MKFISASQHEAQNMLHNSQSLASLHPTSVGFTEQDLGNRTGIPLIREGMPKYHVYTNPDAPGAHAQEVPIALRRARSINYTDHHTYLLSADVAGPGTGNDRHATVVKFRRGTVASRKIAHIQVHLNAAIQDRETGKMHRLERTTVTEKAVDKLRSIVQRLIQDGYEVIITGDFNWRETMRNGNTAPPWDHSPLALAEDLGMRHYSNGLDWILWTKGFVKVGPVKVYPPATKFNKADHPWLAIRLVLKPWFRKHH